MQEDLNLKDSTVKNIQYLVRKIEKLTCAVYKVTSFMDDREDLKWKIRKVSTDVLNDLSSKVESNMSSDPHVLNDVSGRINGLASLFEVAKSSGVVSEMNFSVIKEEYLSVKKNIDIIRGADFDVSSFIDSKEINFNNSRLLGTGLEQRDFYKGHIKDTTKDTQNKGQSIGHQAKSRSVRTENISRNKSVSDSSTSNRGVVIVDFVKRNGSSSIKDIAQVVVGCSEKTIQRELAKLVSRGVLEKRGERRWSKYSIAR